MIYIAGPIGRARACQAFAERLRAHGIRVTSRWHREVGDEAVDPTDELVRRSILADNLEDLDRSRALVARLDLADEDHRPRATWGEIGYALARGIRVFAVDALSVHGRCIFDAHPGIMRVPSEVDAIEILSAWGES